MKKPRFNTIFIDGVKYEPVAETPPPGDREGRNAPGGVE